MLSYTTSYAYQVHSSRPLICTCKRKKQEINKNFRLPDCSSTWNFCDILKRSQYKKAVTNSRPSFPSSKTSLTMFFMGVHCTFVIGPLVSFYCWLQMGKLYVSSDAGMFILNVFGIIMYQVHVPTSTHFRIVYSISHSINTVQR